MRAPINVYCDEAGFTGENLLNDQQPIFSYSAVAIDPAQAQQIVDSVRKKHNLQAPELKGGKLAKRKSGRKAIQDVLEACSGKFLVNINDKRYALACKIFEYAIEPAYSSFNSILYRHQFHRFVAALLYLEFTVRNATAEVLFENFEKWVRTGEKKFLASALLPRSVASTPHTAQVLELIHLNRSELHVEVPKLEDRSKVNKWILDLTRSSLHSVLCQIAESDVPLNVICDEAAPLDGFVELFDPMIGRTNHPTTEVFGSKTRVTFNLHQRIQTASSASEAGLQLADVVSSATTHALLNRHATYAKGWMKYLEPAFDPRSVFPTPDLYEKEVGPGTEAGYLGPVILDSLIECAQDGRDPRSVLPPRLASALEDLRLGIPQLEAASLGRRL